MLRVEPALQNSAGRRLALNLRVVLKLSDGVTTSRAMACANGRPRSLAVCWLPQDRQPEIPLFIGFSHTLLILKEGPNARGKPRRSAKHGGHPQAELVGVGLTNRLGWPQTRGATN